MDIVTHNRKAWNQQSREGSEWCDPVSSQVIRQAQNGQWDVILTPNQPVPKNWFGDIANRSILCLASGGGQQAPILAAAGARVTSFDNSDVQLEKDQMVAERDGLKIDPVQGDMADLSCFPDDQFDLIFNPVSNVFAPDLQPIWRECFRVLKPGGRLMTGFMNPLFFLFDHEELEKGGRFEAKFALPYSDMESLPAERIEQLKQENIAFEFGHSLSDQIGGQLKAGFVLIDLFEDTWNDEATPLNRLSPLYIATLSTKLIRNPVGAG